MREKYEAMGNEMIRNLGFENKKVILFWKAFEEERWLACELHYNCFKKGLTKQSIPSIIIIVNEREVISMNHNIYFLFSILSLVLIAPFVAINSLIALAAVGIAGVFFFIWYLKEMKEEEKNYKKELDRLKNR